MFADRLDEQVPSNPLHLRGGARKILRKADGVFPAPADAAAPAHVYAGTVERPLTTALGWRLPSWLLDFGPVVFIVVEGLGAIAVAHHHGYGHEVGLVLALGASAVALLLRHRWPIGVLAVVLAVSLAVNYTPISELPVLLAVFTVAEYCEREQVIAGAIVSGVVVLATAPVHGSAEAVRTAIPHLIAIGLAVAVGLYLRARADYINGLRERAERLEREHELLAERAVGDERVRIARELHDVVAHNVSLMVVQAQALAATGGTEDERRAALARVADLGREAMSEMHRMLGVLRIDRGAALEREPQPGVRDLQRLLARAREAGLDASLVVEGSPRELPPGVDLSAYRIVQEALTNVIRHAHADHAIVTLAYAPGELDVTVTDDGVGPRQGANGSSDGHGLVGMHERVALFGGRLTTGRGPDGAGYRVQASLPVN
jgi:signal transduction histidine kinase